MREHDARHRERQRDRSKECLDIAAIEVKIVAHTLAWIGIVTPGKALATPVHRGDGESAREQVMKRFKIFLDVFGKPAQYDNQCARVGRNDPAAADILPVTGFKSRLPLPTGWLGKTGMRCTGNRSVSS